MGLAPVGEDHSAIAGDHHHEEVEEEALVTCPAALTERVGGGTGSRGMSQRERRRESDPASELPGDSVSIGWDTVGERALESLPGICC
jgi:hypothetical protein